VNISGTTPAIAANVALMVASQFTHGGQMLGASGPATVWLIKASVIAALVGLAVGAYESRGEMLLDRLLIVTMSLVTGPVIVALFSMLGFGVVFLFTA